MHLVKEGLTEGFICVKKTKSTNSYMNFTKAPE